MFGIISFLFPRRIARLSYLIRVLVCDAISSYLFPDVLIGALPKVIALLFVTIYAAVFVILPRARDLGMRAWWIILAYVPIADFFLGTALTFRRTNPRHNIYRHPEIDPAPPPLPLHRFPPPQ